LALQIAIFLTLSRTAWIGLLINEILYICCVAEKKSKELAHFLLLLSLLVAGFFYLVSRSLLGLLFVVDSSFGGRRAAFKVLEDWSLFAAHPFYTLSEVVYLGILDSFGAIGLLTFLIALIGPLVFYAVRRPSRIQRAIFTGLGTYLFISWSDGALLYIPIMFFYWFLVSLLARRGLRQYSLEN
jgi:hypothetical protein